MEKEYYKETVACFAVSDLPVLFGHKCASQPAHAMISQFNWKVHAGGFKLHPSAKNLQKNNPRKTGEWKFTTPENFSFRWVAFEYLKCASCAECPIRLRLVYKNGNCVIKFNGKSQNGIRTPIPAQIRQEILEMRNFSVVKMKPKHIYINMTKKYSIKQLPPLSQINDIIKYEEWKSRQNVDPDISEFCLDNSCVFSEHFGDDFIIILRSGPVCYDLFCANIRKKDKQVGLDAQFKNNKERFPLYLLCAQDESYHTIPGFCFMMSRNTAQLLTRAKFLLCANGKQFFVSIAPIKCVCFYYKWYGRKCKHILVVERSIAVQRAQSSEKAARKKKYETAIERKNERKKKEATTRKKPGRKKKVHLPEKRVLKEKCDKITEKSDSSSTSSSDEQKAARTTSSPPTRAKKIVSSRGRPIKKKFSVSSLDL